MRAVDPSEKIIEQADTNFIEEFSFSVEDDLTKMVQVVRSGNNFTITIKYADIAILDETQETFQADGPVEIRTTDSGIYLSSYRSMLSDRIRLRRTRFF